MDKALIDIEVINGIIKAYNRTKNQTRIFGIILGTKKDTIYHISDIIYGFIFEEGEDQKTHKKEYVRINEENLNSILNSYTNKFNLFSQQKINEKTSKEKAMTFLSNDNLMILGGFATDKELFDDLQYLYSTIQQINNKTFKILNSLILLVDPNHKDNKVLNYGVKTYIWDMKSIKINTKTNRLLTFKQIENQINENINTINLLNNINNKYLWEKIANLNIDKNEKKNINELLFDLNDKEDKIFKAESNVECIKNKIKECLFYLDIFEKYLENDDEKNKDIANAISDTDYNQIAYVVSKLESMLNDNEIIDALNSDINKKYNLDSLSQLLEVQLTLSDKIRQLIN